MRLMFAPNSLSSTIPAVRVSASREMIRAQRVERKIDAVLPGTSPPRLNTATTRANLWFSDATISAKLFVPDVRRLPNLVGANVLRPRRLNDRRRPGTRPGTDILCCRWLLPRDHDSLRARRVGLKDRCRVAGPPAPQRFEFRHYPRQYSGFQKHRSAGLFVPDVPPLIKESG
jgi:hypothetical protein